MELKNKTVLITGASHRIGRELTLGFADKGAHILVHYNRSAEPADELIRELRERKVVCRSYQADLTDLSSLQQMTKQLLRDNNVIDILINNASKFYPTPIKTTSESQWDEFLAIHIKAPFFLAQHLGPAMKRKGEGRIINVADWTGLRPRKNYLAYCVSKGGLLALTQGLAKELAPEVLVTAVCPGPILVPLGMEEKEQEHIAERTLVKRWGSTTDLVKQVLFLAEQDFATGSFHYMDGGQHPL
jgi:NAD(P)-dependent dehydrogenase (short-subunit alcohol dehydrogenase family)